MSFEDTIRAIVREEVRAALADLHGVPAAVEPAPDFVALGEVRRWVRIGKTTLKEWINSGRLPKYGEGRLVRVRLAEVRAVLEGRAKPKPKPTAGTDDVQRILRSVPGGR